jgi:hypothetical protein
MGIFDVFSSSKRKYQAALTVALAEHTWETLTSAQQDKVQEAVKRVARSAGIDALQVFTLPAHYRAGLQAAAMKELGIPPAVRGESWNIVGNPFAISPEDGEFDQMLEKAYEYLRSKGIEI